MNYKWAKNFTLELINQRSIAGADIAPSYNNQEDYLRRIPRLLDDAALQAAAGAGAMRAVKPLGELEQGKLGAWTTYTLPEDCRRLVCVVRTDGPRLQKYHRYRLVGDDKIALPAELDGEMALEYFRYPALLGEDPGEEAELDNTVEVQTALPYYAAAMLVMGDDAFAYATLMNQFEGKLARLNRGPQTEWETVEDAYSAAEWGVDA